MDGIGILVTGVLVVIVMLAISSTIIAAAPYVAGILVIIGLVWYTLKGEESPPKQ